MSGNKVTDIYVVVENVPTPSGDDVDEVILPNLGYEIAEHLAEKQVEKLNKAHFKKMAEEAGVDTDIPEEVEEYRESLDEEKLYDIETRFGYITISQAKNWN